VAGWAGTRPATAETGEGPLRTAIGFSRALLGRDDLAALDYFGDGARLLTADGTEVSGAAAIGEVLGQLTASSRRLDILPGRTIVSGDVALCCQSRRLSSVTEGETYERGSRATLVLHRCGRRRQILIGAP
jgi:ketosteroid isomerase-like protein